MQMTRVELENVSIAYGLKIYKPNKLHLDAILTVTTKQIFQMRNNSRINQQQYYNRKEKIF